MTVPTPEQAYCIDYFRKGLPMKVVAFAGAGKTSTLVEMAKQSPNSRGLMMCFNKSIATEAGHKFPRHVQCRTTHSIAWGAVMRSGFPENKLRHSPRSRMFDVSMIKGLFPMHVDTFKSIVATVIQRFCQSDSKAIAENHVPRVPGMSEDAQEWLYTNAPVAATAIWSRMIDPHCDLPLGGDGYVKVWSLSNPRLFADFLLVDEAQDLNPVVISVIRNQRAQIIAVGDSHQQIYGWRGARDALKILAGHECRLTQSFRFGDAIAAAANGVLSAMGERFPLHGFPVIQDRVIGNTAEPDAILCRSNAGVIETAIAAIEAGRDVYTPGGVGELRLLVDDAAALKQQQPAKSASLIGFKNWKEVEDYSQTDEGASLKVFVKLVGKYGVSGLIRTLDMIQGEETPGCLTVATAHKAKGLEWPTVRIHEDFFGGDDDDRKISMAERRLFYVAITRAKRTLAVDDFMLDAYSTHDEDLTDD